MLGRRRLTFVPLDWATVAPSHVRVALPGANILVPWQVFNQGPGSSIYLLI